MARSADHLCALLRSGLGQWIGANGYRVLLDRALGEARPDHPVLGTFGCQGGDDPATLATVKEHGPDALAAGMVALLTVLIALLGRIMGDEMAVHLVEQTGTPRPSNVGRALPEEELHG